MARKLTREQRAAEVVMAISPACTTARGARDDYPHTFKSVFSAIREAENEALERAAVATGECGKRYWAASMKDAASGDHAQAVARIAMRDACHNAVRVIRALKEKP